jgi:hypothetical protein
MHSFQELNNSVTSMNNYIRNLFQKLNKLGTSTRKLLQELNKSGTSIWKKILVVPSNIHPKKIRGNISSKQRNWVGMVS